jgi:MSHA biogenesis protein MshJ
MNPRMALQLPSLPDLRQRLAQLRARERALLFIVALVLALFAWDDTVLQRLDLRWRFLSSELSELATSGESTGIAAGNLATLAALSERAATLSAQVAEAQAQLRARSAGFVEPTRMPQLVRDLLAARAGLSLVRLANLPPEEIRATIGDGSAPAAVGDDADDEPVGPSEPSSAVAYSHGLEIVVEGRFQDLYDYLQVLEQQPWHVLWRAVEIEVIEHPRARARVVIATIGVDRDWLGT